MKTIEVKLYEFNELSEEAKKRVLSDHYDINTLDVWWRDMYEDAENIGLIIMSFDIDRGSYVNANFKTSPAETAEEIIKNHGETCDTYKTAMTFLSDLDILTGQYPNIEDCPEDEIEALEEEFLTLLQKDYLKMLMEEYEHLTNDEAIIETLEANEYYFTESGKMYNA